MTLLASFISLLLFVIIISIIEIAPSNIAKAESFTSKISIRIGSSTSFINNNDKKRILHYRNRSSSSSSSSSDDEDITAVEKNDKIVFEELINEVYSYSSSSNIIVNLDKFGKDDTIKRRGIGISKSISEGEDILRIPMSVCVMPVDDNDNDYNGIREGDDEVLLAVSLINTFRSIDRGNNNDKKQRILHLWKSMLPSSKDLRLCLPIHWTDVEINNLSPYSGCSHQTFEQMIHFIRARRLKNIQSIMNIVRDDCSEEEAIQALDIIQTRSCRVSEEVDYDDYDDDDDDEYSIQILAPIFDLINHDNNDNTNAYYSLESTYSDGYFLAVRASRNIIQGEEILIDYGISAKSPWQCLIHYGFVPTTIDNYHTARISFQEKVFYVTSNSVSYGLVKYLQHSKTKNENNANIHDKNEQLLFTSEIALQIINISFKQAKLLQNNTSSNNNINTSSSSFVIQQMIELQYKILFSLCLNIQKHVETSWKNWNFDSLSYNDDNDLVYIIPPI